eukprot:6387341-Amphidinium_carterae.1
MCAYCVGLETTVEYRQSAASPPPKKGCSFDPLLGFAKGGDSSGNYAAWDFSVGSHTVTATGFSASSAEGHAGAPLSVTITVTEPSAPPETMSGDFDELRGVELHPLISVCVRVR